MKIALVTTFYHPVTGGVETHVAEISKYLQKQGHEVVVLTSDSAKVGPRIQQKESVINGIKTKRFRTWFSLSQYHRFYPGLLFYLLKNDFDVVHVHGFRKFETYLALLAARLKRKKVVLTTHNPFPTTTRTRMQEIFIKIHDLTFGKFLIKKLDKIITILDSEHEIFINQFKVKKEKLITIYNGLNPFFINNKGSKEAFEEQNNIKLNEWDGVVIGCGRLNYAKGFQFLKQAVTNLPNVLFFIAGGDDGYYQELKELYKNDKNMVLNGVFIPQEKLINVYAAGDIFVLPSIHEATGTVMLEALSQGCPIIATQNGGTEEYLTKEHGIFIDPTDENAWEENIKFLLNNPLKRREFLKGSEEFLEKFKWDILVDQIIKVYEEIRANTKK